MEDGIGIVRATIERGSPALAAFDLLLAHALAARLLPVPRTGVVRSVELQWPDRRRNPFSLQAHARHVLFYLRGPVLRAHPGLREAAIARFGPVERNSRDEYHTRVRSVDEAEAVLDLLRERGAWPSDRAARSFTAATLAPVGAGHVLAAARLLASGFGDHPFGESTDYDVVFDGRRFAPKAVFGLAASEALGFPVRPENIRGGEDTVCFRALRRFGYEVVAKGAPAAPRSPLVSDEDRTWAEGRPRLVAHLARERGTGVAAAKREAFRARHGRLFCERCGMDPVATFGSEVGEACIEVHHHAAAVADMAPGHQTALEDLRCLCANCHRVVHRELKAA